MIGQRNLQKQLNDLIENNKFPRFAVFVGAKGSGKKLIADTISKQLTTYQIKAVDLSVGTIREIIQEAYKQRESCCYILADADTMSLAAKNALLKVTEEPPNNSYFIMTLEDINNTPETIKSRATVFNMETYTQSEIVEFYTRQFPKGTKEEKELVKSICTTMGEAMLFVSQKPVEFINYIKSVYENINEVSGANSFKIANRISLKEDAEGFDLELFWKCFILYCMNEYKATKEQAHIERLKITSKYLRQLKTKGINKQMLFDCWILDIRKVEL